MNNLLRWGYITIIIIAWLWLLLTLTGPPLERLFIAILVTLLALILLSDSLDDISKLLKKLWNSFRKL